MLYVKDTCLYIIFFIFFCSFFLLSMPDSFQMHSADLTVAGHDIFAGAQLRQPHRAARMELLR